MRDGNIMNARCNFSQKERETRGREKKIVPSFAVASGQNHGAVFLSVLLKSFYVFANLVRTIY